ncbi:hypothetical protein AB0O01_28560 [Streptomyces sp. NPDC093252]|uniref:hypothetical protein n=1 Tax=Streptomyces sp. NPDC093252 TaxID=3154980 RepID=UPI003437803C
MWPGQQPPGGEQNPQGHPEQGHPQQHQHQGTPSPSAPQQNPYQQPGTPQPDPDPQPGAQPNPQPQPGAPQPNPYQQPGYQQPNPYQQPGYQQTPYPHQPHQPPQPHQSQHHPAWTVPTPVSDPQPPSGGGGNRTRLVAIVAATAVVIAAGVTGYLVLGGDQDSAKDPADAGGPEASQSASREPAGSPSAQENPRGTETEKPTVPGWKVVVNPKWGIAFDVPADWEVQSPTLSIGFEESDSDDFKPLITMAGTALYQSKWCTSDDNKDGSTDDTSLGAVGTKGADGAKDTDEVAINNVSWWVYGGYTQPDRKSVQSPDKAEPFTTDSGIQGSIAWARSTNTPQTGKCASDGKALTFGFKNSSNDFVSWNFYGAKGVQDEIPDADVLKILKTVRLHGEPTGG